MSRYNRLNQEHQKRRLEALASDNKWDAISITLPQYVIKFGHDDWLNTYIQSHAKQLRDAEERMRHEAYRG
jgi:hypothetical protein